MKFNMSAKRSRNENSVNYSPRGGERIVRISKDLSENRDFYLSTATRLEYFW